MPGGEGAPREGADRRVSILVRAAEEKGVGLCVYLQVKVEVCRRFSALGSRTHRPLPRCQSSLLNYTLVVCANTVRREKERHAPSMKHGPVQILWRIHRNTSTQGMPGQARTWMQKESDAAYVRTPIHNN